MVDKTREIALKILYKIDKDEAYSNIALKDVLNNNKGKIDERDIGFISEIVYGTITWKLTIDEIIKKHSNIKIKKISIWILNILRMGIYQIIFLDRVPKSAAVNESVNLAKRYGHRGSSNFVNAILRKVDYIDYEEFNKIQEDDKRISLINSMPLWIVDKLLKEKTIEETNQICEDSNIRPKVSIRINNLKTNKEDIEKELNKRKIKFEEGILKDFLILDKVKNIENLDLFNRGLFTVQDEVAGLACEILNPKQGENILDCCSAPGGKTTYMAEIMKNKGRIVAWDIHEHRTNLINETAKRLGISIITTEVQDATLYKEEYYEKFDKILLDVPCLGLGVLKRKPDIKWRKNENDIREIIKIQEKLLNTCSKYLKKGGEILYSTCSILREENDNIIDNFLEENKNFEISKYDLDNKKYFKKFLKNNKYIQVYQNSKTDGFFICKLLKN